MLEKIIKTRIEIMSSMISYIENNFLSNFSYNLICLFWLWCLNQLHKTVVV